MRAISSEPIVVPPQWWGCSYSLQY